MNELETIIEKVLEQGNISEERAAYLVKYIGKILNTNESDMLIAKSKSKLYFPISCYMNEAVRLYGLNQMSLNFQQMDGAIHACNIVKLIQCIKKFTIRDGIIMVRALQ